MKLEKKEVQSKILPHIYAPQGRCARLNSCANHLQIGGLMTDSFSTCLLLAVWNEQACSLFHIDRMTVAFPDLIAKEVDWVKQENRPTQCTIVFREISTELANMLSSYIENTTKIKVNLIPAHDSIFGVTLNFKSGLQIAAKEKLPETCLYHPQTPQFENAHKIEEIFTNMDSRFRKRQAVIFDGFLWQQLAAEELNPHLDTQFRQDFLKLFNKTSTQLDYAQIVRKGFSCAGITIPGDDDLSHWMADGVLLYLRKLDYQGLFDTTMRKLLDSPRYNIKLDKTFRNQLLTALSDKSKAGTAFLDVLKKHSPTGSGTYKSDYQRTVINLGLEYARNYLAYHNKRLCLAIYKSEKEKFDNLLPEAISLAEQNSFDEAIVTYQKCLSSIPYCGLITPLELIKVYIGLGECYRQINSFEESEAILHIISTLCEQHNLDECELNPNGYGDKVSKSF